MDKCGARLSKTPMGRLARGLPGAGMDPLSAAASTPHTDRIGQLRRRIDSVDAQIAAQRRMLALHEARHWVRDASLDLLHNLVESKATYRALLSALEDAPRRGT